MSRICDVSRHEQATHEVVVTVRPIGDSDPGNFNEVAFDAGPSAMAAIQTADWFALGQLVPAKYRTKKPVAARKPPAGAAPAALTGALSGE